jgi:hypothetical protein
MLTTSRTRSASAAHTKAVKSFACYYNALAGSGLQDE